MNTEGVNAQRQSHFAAGRTWRAAPDRDISEGLVRRAGGKRFTGMALPAKNRHTPAGQERPGWRLTPRNSPR